MLEFCNVFGCGYAGKFVRSHVAIYVRSVFISILGSVWSKILPALYVQFAFTLAAIKAMKAMKAMKATPPTGNKKIV